MFIQNIQESKWTQFTSFTSYIKLILYYKYSKVKPTLKYLGKNLGQAELTMRLTQPDSEYLKIKKNKKKKDVTPQSQQFLCEIQIQLKILKY